MVPLRVHRRELGLASCGWLVSEVIRRLLHVKNLPLDPSKICSLCTKEGNLLLDLHLAELDRRIPELLEAQILVPVLLEKPTTNMLSLLPRVGQDDFELVRKLGAGGFSVVFLVRKRSNGQYYAMKVIDKALMVEREKLDLIINERNILTQMRHKRVVRLHYAFQSVEYFLLIF